MQTPYHGDRKAENQDVCQQVQYPTSDGKTRQIDAFSSFNGSVPEGCHRCALKDRYHGETEPLAKDKCGANTDSQAKSLGWRKEPIVEQQEGCFCRGGSG